MFLEKKSNVFGKRIQGVQIFDKFSYINVSFKDAEKLMQAFRNEGRNNKNLIEKAK